MHSKKHNSYIMNVSIIQTKLSVPEIYNTDHRKFQTEDSKTFGMQRVYI